MLSKSILVSGISNLSDARYCSGMGVAYLGVCTDPENPAYLSVDTFNEINGWLSGINWILETDATTVGEILIKLDNYAVAGVYTSDPKIASELAGKGIKVLLKLPENAEISFSEQLIGVVVAYEKVSSSIYVQAKLAESVPIYVTGNFSNEDLEEIKEDTSISGIVLYGGIEERPGFKNMDDLIDSLEIFEEY